MIRVIREYLSPGKMRLMASSMPACRNAALRHAATKINYYYMKSSCTAFTNKDVNGHAIPCAL